MKYLCLCLFLSVQNGNKELPPRPKLSQNKIIFKILFASNIVPITKTLFVSLEKDHKHNAKIIVSEDYFVIISARMVRLPLLVVGLAQKGLLTS